MVYNFLLFHEMPHGSHLSWRLNPQNRRVLFLQASEGHFVLFTTTSRVFLSRS